MIAINIQGGLGNQLFQYAAGRALALRFGHELILDTRLVDSDPKRCYSLDAYSIVARRCNSTLLSTPRRRQLWIAPLGLRIGSLRSFPFDAPQFEESREHGTFDTAWLSVKAPVVLSGYFQSERYFAPIERQIREELMPVSIPNESFERARFSIAQAGEFAVSLHIRRGDYAHEARTKSVHGLVGLEYYSAAVARIRQLVPKAHFFIFTDELDAVSELHPLGLPITIVSQGGVSDVNEIALMSLCRHHIIANSSFSWWGAWLGSANGLTVAPRRWFATVSDASIRDRFPVSWEIM